jgi:hypothetical protein
LGRRPGGRWQLDRPALAFLVKQRAGEDPVAMTVLLEVFLGWFRLCLSAGGLDDDDGVKTRQFPIIKAGIFVGCQTIRDQAHLIGQT